MLPHSAASAAGGFVQRWLERPWSEFSGSNG